MPTSEGPTGTVQTKVYVAAGHSAAAPTDAQVKAPATGLFVDANLLDECTAFGPIDLSGNIASWTPLGSGTEKTLAGAASLGEFPVRFVAREDQDPDAVIIKLAIGAKIEAVAIKTTATGKSVAYYVKGTLAGLNFAFETPSEVEARIALAERPTRIEAAA